ncbi:MAG: hypothetical protein ACJAS1_004987 [Oleiphilaceae bacterium]|jgi:hypothetical protein
MNNASEVFDYKPFLKEVYIDPIRSVTVIDDEYPTLEKLLVAPPHESEAEINVELKITLEADADVDEVAETIAKKVVKAIEAAEGKAVFEYADSDKKRLMDAIHTCRKPENNWMLDVHDGKDQNFEGNQVASRLHHSDLLILDYHLDGEEEGACEQSLDILKHLAGNRNFNLVAVHTKGYDSAKGSVNDVFLDIICSLQKMPEVSQLHGSPLALVNNAIDEWDIDVTGIKEKLLNSISNLDLLELCRIYGKNVASKALDSDIFNDFKTLYDEKPKDITINSMLLSKWLLSKKLEALAGRFGESNYQHFDWVQDADCNWVKTDDLFVTILGKKETSVGEIPDHILNALNNWMPHPHKLILTKLRHEIDQNGISAAQNILNKEYLQAAWLQALLSSDDVSVNSKSWGVITKLWEELAYEIKPSISEFVTRLSKELRDANESGKISELFISEDVFAKTEMQTVHSNCFNCSKNIDGYHLTTGHILKIESTYWLCLTPVCDLEPGQKDFGYKDYMPVTLVQLYNAKSAWKLSKSNMYQALGLDEKTQPKVTDGDVMAQVLKQATENHLLFVRLGDNTDEITYLSFTVSLDGKSNPKSKEYLVSEKGIFDEETKNLILYRADICNEEKVPVMAQYKATVVAELRYEYALNLLQRLGISKSRVGLEFEGVVH